MSHLGDPPVHTQDGPLVSLWVLRVKGRAQAEQDRRVSGLCWAEESLVLPPMAARGKAGTGALL